MSTLAPPRVEPVPDDRVHISRVPYLPGLDGMRALAVAAVMVYHANSDWLPGGFFGVEMFFVISGYLITLLLISERERTYRISLRHFWLRRARRLLPALFTMMFLVTVWTAIFKTEALGALRGDVIAGFFYVSNWYQIWEGLGYTAAGDFAPLRHLWSLAVEEQFYLLWPVVMIFLLGRNGTRQVAAVSRWLFVCAVVITVAVALLFYPGPIAEPNVTPEAYWWFGDRPINKIDTLYLGTISRLSGILLGAAFAMVWRPLAIVRGPLRSKGRLFDAVALAGIIGFAWLCWNTYLATPSGADPFVFRGGIFLAGLATLSIIAAVTHRGAYANRLLGNRVFRWIGTRSYGLYLYHWPIYQMIRGVAGNKLTFGEFVYALVLTVIVTELSYRFVETPIRQGRFSARWRQIFGGTRRGPKVVASAAVAMAVVVGLAVGSVLMTAPLEKNEIAQALDAGEEFTTDLLAVDDIPVASTTTTSTTPTTHRGAARHDGSGGPRPDARLGSADHRATHHRAAHDGAADHGATGPRRSARGRDQPRGTRSARDPADRVGLPARRARRLGDARRGRGAPGPGLPGRRAPEPADEHLRADDAGAAGQRHVRIGGGGPPRHERELQPGDARRDVGHGGRCPGRAVADRQGRPGMDRRQQRQTPRRAVDASQRDRRRLGGPVIEL